VIHFQLRHQQLSIFMKFVYESAVGNMEQAWEADEAFSTIVGGINFGPGSLAQLKFTGESNPFRLGSQSMIQNSENVEKGRNNLTDL
jgi:hypothetical protein